VAEIARAECDAAVAAATAMRGAGLPCGIVSVGSTPTVLHAPSFAGISEVRCGIYMFWDLSQASRHICGIDDIAVSVLASVISHSKAASALILDAGALALSKDLSARRYMPEAGYGLVCDPATAAPLPGLAVATVHQEHGTVPVRDPAWFERLPVGSVVRVLPNHACITCAAYDAYTVVVGQEIVGTWQRVNGW
jgi:D-serine deaminase-like pyridoxal phosphate-dependent protein